MSARATVPVACPPQGNKLFAGIDPARVREALDHATPEEHRAGGPLIFEADATGDCLYLIESGNVRIFRGASGGEETFVVLGPADYFGEMALFADHRRSASAAAVTDCRVWRLPFAAFGESLDHEFELTRNLLDGAQRRLRAIDERYLQELIQRERLSFVGRMAASIIHDLKGPLSAIRMAAELIGETVPGPDTHRRTHLIVHEVDRLASMVGDVLDYCRSEKRLDPHPTELGGYLNEVFEVLRPTFDQRGIKLELAARVTEPVTLDPQRFHRVLYNLATNAAEAMPRGGRLTVTADRDGDHVRIEVADTGCGIAPHQQEQIWQPFVTFGKKNGTGLGLPIAKKIVEDHGGTITLRSELNVGTTFTIRLPLHGPQ
ncbi:MAG: cyclic nucleotide-binding domain-containing protein [Verrucomicrobia bacterium]|nr:cyclic nucleotide-binding domain-containing protein [Verrucomicrobiota bacterium]